MNLKRAIIAICTALLIVSCSTPSKTAYLNDMETGTAYTASPAPVIKVQPEDRISIRILSNEPLLVAPFSDASGSGTNGDTGLYTVDSEGKIDFPVLGTLYVSGMTLEEIRDDIATRIENKGYIKNPSVKVALDNFTVTVIGQTNQSVMRVEDNSINLFQVVANSNLIPSDTDIRNVTVVRTENGKRTAHKVNLQSKDIFDSPVFYLKQNDIVYFRQKGVKLSPTGETALKIFSSTFSFITSIGYVSWWLKER